MKSAKRILIVGTSAVLVTALLFVANGLDPGWETPDSGTTATPPIASAPQVIRVAALNLAKAGFHLGGARFQSREVVEQRLDEAAAALREADAHLVFLSEIARGDGPSPVDQVTYLADALDMHAWAYGDNYSFGLPFYRLRSGNAILARMPLAPRDVQQLAGARPFYNPTNNRRVLWCDILLGSNTLRIGSIRNDSFDLKNNARQVEETLATLGDLPALLAGDFNAEPHDESMRRLRESDRFTAAWDGAATFPARAPTRRIDYVLAPASWTLLEHRVLNTGFSDHLAALSVFERDH